MATAPAKAGDGGQSGHVLAGPVGEEDEEFATDAADAPEKGRELGHLTGRDHRSDGLGPGRSGPGRPPAVAEASWRIPIGWSIGILRPRLNGAPSVLPIASGPMKSVVVASFNVHGGVDGFGRPFDVVAACQEIDADVLILQESWSPASGEPLAQLVGRTLGYEVDELAMTGARVSTAPPSVGPSSWGPVLVARGPWGLRVGEEREGRPRHCSTSSRFPRPARAGPRAG